MTLEFRAPEDSLSPSLFAKPYVDLVFKRVFGRKENTAVLRSFLTDLLCRTVIGVRLENNEMPAHDDLDGKSVRYDVLVTVSDPDGEHVINLEIQNVSHPSIPKRAMYYGSRLYLDQLRKGEPYDQLVPTVVVFILNFEFFVDEGETQAVRSFCMTQKGGGQELMPQANPLVLTFLELPKHAKSSGIPVGRMTPLQRWLTFLCARSDDELEELRLISPEFDEAISEIEYAKLSDAEKRYYRARMDYLRDQHSIMTENVEYASREARAKALIEGRQEGLAEGRAEGRAEGLALGEAEAKRKLIWRMLSKKFGLSLEQAHGALPSGVSPLMLQSLEKLQQQIAALDPSQLDGFIDKILDAANLEELLKDSK